MDTHGIYSTAKLSHGASMAELLELEDQLKAILPLEYKQFLQITNGAEFACGVVIYPAGEVYEVNETYAVAEYLPGYLAIGDDSGGQFVVIPYAGEGVYAVGQGCLDEGFFEVLAESIHAWVQAGCHIP